MKKVIGAILTALVLTAVVAPEHKADAQVVVYSNRCCDSYGYVRCILVNGAFPVGSACFCQGQGYGTVC